jgi:hypothetical protein
MTLLTAADISRGSGIVIAFNNARAVFGSKVLTSLSTRIIHGANHRCRNVTLRSDCVIVPNDELYAVQYLKSSDSKNFTLMDGFLASLSLQVLISN